MWHKPCRTFHPWCLCIKTRCLYQAVMSLLERFLNQYLDEAITRKLSRSLVLCVCNPRVFTLTKGSQRTMTFSSLLSWTNFWITNQVIGKLRRYCNDRGGRCIYNLHCNRRSKYWFASILIIVTVASHEHHGIIHHRQIDCLFSSFF